MKDSHADLIRKLVSAGVSWKVIHSNRLDDPRLPVVERDELIQTAIRQAGERKGR